MITIVAVVVASHNSDQHRVVQTFPNVSRSPSPVPTGASGSSGTNVGSSSNALPRDALQDATGLRGLQQPIGDTPRVRQANVLKRSVSPTAENERQAPMVRDRELREATDLVYELEDAHDPQAQLRLLSDISTKLRSIGTDWMAKGVARDVLNWWESTATATTPAVDAAAFDLLTSSRFYDGLEKTPAVVLNHLPALAQAGLADRALAFVKDSLGSMDGSRAGDFADKVLKKEGSLAMILSHVPGRETEVFAPVALAVRRGVDAAMFNASLHLDPLFKEAPQLLAGFPTLTQDIFDTLHHGLSKMKPGEDNLDYSMIPDLTLRTWAEPLLKIATSPGQVSFDQLEGLRLAAERAANIRQTKETVRFNISFDGSSPRLQIIRQARDQRSAAEIERTATLHRAGPQQGLDDLAGMRAGLGRSANAEQAQRARSYAEPLQKTEADLRQFLDGTGTVEERQSALARVRQTARDIESRVEDDYAKDAIVGADYESVMRQLAILFRRIPE